ncbi:MAG: hypothetical protein OXC82_10270 [Rhodobacteraceae bacterium]|nr:hypothetical protein [Paracoccaceae bacterium]MCY4250801.1 hypothetical protein [Paracoccaceae bacterium]
MNNESFSSSNKLIGIGGALVMVPVPQVKILGMVAIGVGLGFEIYDEIQKRR